MILQEPSRTSFAVLTDDDRRMFFEIGIAGMEIGRKMEANLLFFNLMEADPESAYPALGLAYCRMMAGQFAEAHHYLNLPRVRASELARLGLALQALAFHLEGRRDDLKQTLEMIDLGIEDAASSVARALVNPN